MLDYIGFYPGTVNYRSFKKSKSHSISDVNSEAADQDEGEEELDEEDEDDEDDNPSVTSDSKMNSAIQESKTLSTLNPIYESEDNGDRGDDGGGGCTGSEFQSTSQVIFNHDRIDNIDSNDFIKINTFDCDDQSSTVNVDQYPIKLNTDDELVC